MFKALSSRTRIEILRRIIGRECHISLLSRELKISKSVISRHVKVLEKAGLVRRKKIGNVHLLSANLDALGKTFEPIVEEQNVEAVKGSTIFDILKQIPGIEMKEYNGSKFITSVDGEEGLYIYEVDGEVPEKAVNEYKLEKDVILQLKKLIPVTKKKIKIEVRDSTSD